MTELPNKLYRLMIPTTSLFQIYEYFEDKFDKNIVALEALPKRTTTTEKDEPADIPYVRFAKKIEKKLYLTYNDTKHNVFGSAKVIKSCVDHGIDDCPIEDITLKFVNIHQKKIYWLRFHSTSVKLTTKVGQYVKNQRDKYIQKFGTEFSSRVVQGRTAYRQLEYREGYVQELDGPPVKDRLTIQQLQDKDFLEWIQKASSGLILVKEQKRYKREIFRDDTFYNGFVDLSELESTKADGEVKE